MFMKKGSNYFFKKGKSKKILSYLFLAKYLRNKSLKDIYGLKLYLYTLLRLGVKLLTLTLVEY